MVMNMDDLQAEEYYAAMDVFVSQTVLVASNRLNTNKTLHELIKLILNFENKETLW